MRSVFGILGFACFKQLAGDQTSFYNRTAGISVLLRFHIGSDPELSESWPCNYSVIGRCLKHFQLLALHAIVGVRDRPDNHWDEADDAFLVESWNRNEGICKSRHRLYSVFNRLLPAIGEGQVSGQDVTEKE
jgi:hypothetical protein